MEVEGARLSEGLLCHVCFPKRQKQGRVGVGGGESPCNLVTVNVQAQSG